VRRTARNRKRSGLGTAFSHSKVRKSATKRMLGVRIDTAKERLCTRIALLQALSKAARSYACSYCYLRAALQTRRSIDGRAMGM
jgi:hypothetical protein